jgi:hypothetical protein
VVSSLQEVFAFMSLFISFVHESIDFQAVVISSDHIKTDYLHEAFAWMHEAFARDYIKTDYMHEWFARAHESFACDCISVDYVHEGFTLKEEGLADDYVKVAGATVELYAFQCCGGWQCKLSDISWMSDNW